MAIVIAALVALVALLRRPARPDWSGHPTHRRPDGPRTRDRGRGGAVAGRRGVRAQVLGGGQPRGHDPGHDPGELAITRSEYDHWLEEMGVLGVRLVRVYTLLPPGFYEALALYDREHPRAPLWLLQGIYLDQDRLDSVHNAYDPTLHR
jgi:hypothetical protein